MKQLLAWEFCRVTKLHLDNILSTKSIEIDVSVIIQTMQEAIEFENDLQRQFFKLQTEMESNYNEAITNENREMN